MWKRASLAIDPDAIFDATDQRHWLVDTASREGLSGSVVIARVDGVTGRGDGSLSVGGPPHLTKVVGIYSGRIGSDDHFAAQIGIVWPINLVEQLLLAQQRDDFHC